MGMTREEAIEFIAQSVKSDVDMALVADAIKALEQEPSRDMKEIKEVINCDADAETKCKMISNIFTAKPHYFEEPQESEAEDGKID